MTHIETATDRIERAMTLVCWSPIKPVVMASVLLLTLTCPPAPAWAQTLSQRLKTEPIETLAQAARQKGDAVKGAVLFTQQNLNCVRCHAPGVGLPVGPNLRELSSDVTDAYLVEALLDPSKAIRKGFESVTVVTKAGKAIPGRILDQTPDRVRLQEASGDLRQLTLPRSEIDQIAPNPISTMPANLVDLLANRQQFLDLVRYTIELSDASKLRSARGQLAHGKAIGPELQGVVLLKDFHCAACHRDDVTSTPLTEKQPPDLTKAAGRMNPTYLRRYVADPLHVKPGTTMPDMMSRLEANERQRAAEEITHYLLSIGDRSFAVQPVDPKAATRGRETFHTVGCVACHSPRDENQRELLAESSVALGELRDRYGLDGLIAFLKNPLEFRPSGRMPQMQLTHWEAVDVANYLLSGPAADSDSAGFPLDPALAAQGKARFTKLGCRQCHQTDTSDSVPNAMNLSAVRPDQGCLSGAQGQWPQFNLSAAQRTAIQAALTRANAEHTPQDDIAITLTAFRCLNCHQRDELGGVTAERNPHFQTANPNLGPQGRIPPTLTKVGAKLNPTWMRQVLVSGRAIRPYVMTRMPQFGTDNVSHLVDLFGRVDQLEPVSFATFKDQKQMRTVGAEMVGTGGLNCIVCHTFQLKKAANMPAVDLTEMAERLQKDWFYHYMRDPQRLSQNTIMPSFWPGGRAMRRDILDGDRDLQIEAIWQYLLDGRQARTPRGLIREPLELLATDEAVMLRRSYPGIGKRGIGVGYPHQVNLAFDAEQMRLAMIWKGKFADPGGVWRSQGHGQVRPLGERPIRFAPGPDLDNSQSPWIVDDGRPPHHQFKGYSLDSKMRPAFTYEFAGIEVEDYSQDLLDSSTGKPFIRRTVKLTSDSIHSSLVFRAATGEGISQLDDGLFQVDNKLSIRVRKPHSATVVDGTEFQQLRIPLELKPGTTTLTLEYRW